MERTRKPAGRGATPSAAARPLTGRVAIVAGATRGAGRGVAWALGEAGATVYCTGRSTAGSPSAYKRRETIEETASLVTEAGGIGVAVRVDHNVDAEVAALMTRVKREHGHVDVLVCSLAGEDPTLPWRRRLASVGPAELVGIFQRVIVSHLNTVRHALPLLRSRSLVVEVTEGDTLFLGGITLPGILVKTLQKISAYLLAQDLLRKRITAIAVTPGFLRSESMLEHFKVTEATWREGGRKDKHFLESETPRFLGRGIAALAADPRRLERSGALTSSWDLARAYEVQDADGRRPDWGAHIPEVSREYTSVRTALEAEAAWLEALAARCRKYAGRGVARRR